MKLLTLATNDSGSTYYRQELPVLALQAAGYKAEIIALERVNERILAQYDTVLVSRQEAPAALEAIENVQWRGMTLLVDYDDDVLGIPEHNPAHETDTATIKAICRKADGVVVTNESLASVFKPYAKAVAVVPNYIDVRRWPKIARTPGEPPIIGLGGSPSHIKDWEIVAEPLKRICKEFPDVRVKLFGFLPDYLVGIATEFVQWVRSDDYPRALAGIDIGLCPLLDDDFNKRKTPIKSYEYALAGAAVVASPTLYLSTVRGKGTIARTEADWYQAIRRYLLDPQARQRDADELRRYVQKLDIRLHGKSIYAAYAALTKRHKCQRNLPTRTPQPQAA